MVSGPTSRAVGRSKEEEDDAVLPISIPDSDGSFKRRWGTLWIKHHSRNTVSYP